MKRDIETPIGVVHVKGNGHKRPLRSFNELTPEVRATFDYMANAGHPLDDSHDDRRFFEYRGSWYDLYDGFEIRDAPTWITDAGYEAWQTESAFSAVLVRYTTPDGDHLLDDGDSIVVGYAHW